MDRLFEGLLEGTAKWPGAARAGDFAPSCDIQESDNHYLMSFDLPGVKKEDVKIDLRDNVLTVSGERNDATEENKKNHFRSERFHGSYSRSFALPAGVKAEQIESEY